MDQEAGQILDQLGVHFESLRLSVANLSSEQRQMIAIAKVMASSPQIIIIDDPTRLMGYLYQQKLLSLIQVWQRQNTAVLFSSNNLDHLLAVTDRIIVLRKGRREAEFRTDEADRDDILAVMVGTTDRGRVPPPTRAFPFRTVACNGRSERADRMRSARTRN